MSFPEFFFGGQILLPQQVSAFARVCFSANFWWFARQALGCTHGSTWPLWCPSGKSTGISCSPLQRGGSNLISLQTSAFPSLGCVMVPVCQVLESFSCSLQTHRSPWSTARVSRNRSVDSRISPLYKSLCLGWKISRVHELKRMENPCLWVFTAPKLAAGLGWLPQSVTLDPSFFSSFHSILLCLYQHHSG